jgi:hypothetical protein
VFIDFLSGFSFSFLLFDLLLASLCVQCKVYTVIVCITILHVRELESCAVKGWSINPGKGKL